jgi:hypothetical protein
MVENIRRPECQRLRNEVIVDLLKVKPPEKPASKNLRAKTSSLESLPLWAILAELYRLWALPCEGSFL